jgi:phage baseplate assembly protein V
MIRTIQKALAPIRRRVMLMVQRGTIKSLSDGGKLQTAQVQGLGGKLRDGVEVFQSYGFTSVPKAGAEAVIVAVGGNDDHGLIIAHGDRRYRLTGLAAGEVALHDDQGAAVHLSRGGIQIKGGGKPVAITGAALVTVQMGTIVVTGGDVVADGVSLKEVGGFAAGDGVLLAGMLHV